MHESARETRLHRSASVAGTPARATSESAAARPTEGIIARLQSHWPLGAILGVFVVSMFIVPTLANVTISDDWIYQWSVERLVLDHKLEVHPLVSSHLIFQTLWGGLFGFVFGVTPGVMRLSVVVLWLLSGIAFYGLAWELTAKRALSALGTVVYLFNPLGYSLAFTFMTDIPFIALLVIALYCYVRGLRTGVADGWILAGSVVTALAVLQRQPALFIPVGILGALIVMRTVWFTRRSVVIALEIGVLPVLAYLAYYWWLHNINGTPVVQNMMQDEILLGGWTALEKQTEQLAAIEAIYLGLFMLPLAAGAAMALRPLLPGVTRWGWIAFVVWQTFVLVAFFGLRAAGMQMPYIPHFLSVAGIGPNDLLVARPRIASHEFLFGLTLLSAVSAVVAGFVVIRALGLQRPTPRFAVVLGTFACQAGAVIIVSTHFRYWVIAGLPAPSLDRYIVPLLPLALLAVLWALRDVEIHLPLAWYVAGVLALFAIVGTRDNLVFHQAQWDVAQAAVDSGIPLEQLDGGGSWTGSHVGERSWEERGTVGSDRWWLGLYGSLIDPQYVVATAELPGYTTVSKHPYSLWLDTSPTNLYLLHRDPAPRAP